MYTSNLDDFKLLSANSQNSRAVLPRFELSNCDYHYGRKPYLQVMSRQNAVRVLQIRRSALTLGTDFVDTANMHPV